MSYQCCQCKHIFTEEEALCEDVLDIQKCLGCPKCNSFLAPTSGFVDFRPSSNWYLFLVITLFIGIVINDIFFRALPILIVKIAIAYAFIATLLHMIYIFFKGGGMPTRTILASEYKPE